jgi:hypothetical protein
MASDRQELTRRQALKALTAAAGGVALNFIPKAWKTPVVSVGALPAHAQISDCPGDMCAIASTTTMVESEFGMEYGDFDFSLCTPNGAYVWGGNSADGATSSQDNIAFDPVLDNETLNIGTAVPGTYSLYLENYSGTGLEMTVHITTDAGIHSNSFTLTEHRAVADVTFPGGTVVWRSDLTDPECWGETHRIAKGK